MRLLIGSVCLIFLGCSSSLAIDRAEWTEFGHPLFLSRVNDMSGPGAINCGHFDLLTGAGREGMRQSSPSRCIKNAVKTGQPFKFGTLKIVSDLYMFRALIAAPDSKFWIVDYGVMVDQSDHHTRVTVCDSVRVQFNPIFYKRKGCVSVDSQEWYDGTYSL